MGWGVLKDHGTPGSPGLDWIQYACQPYHLSVMSSIRVQRLDTDSNHL